MTENERFVAPALKARSDNLKELMDDAKVLKNLPKGKLTEGIALIIVRRRFPTITEYTQKSYSKALCDIFNSRIKLD